MSTPVSRGPYLDQVKALLEKEQLIIRISKLASTKLHLHAFLEFVYILEGTVGHRLGEQTSILHAGDFFLVDYGVPHQYFKISNSPVQIMNCMFLPEFIDASLINTNSAAQLAHHYLIKYDFQYLNPHPSESIFHDNGTLRPFIDNMIIEYRKKQAGYRQVIRTLLLYAILHMMRMACKSPTLMTEYDLPRHLRGYIDQHYSEQCLLADFAEEFHFSVAHISRRFKQDMGKTFSAYLRDVRINNACRLLANTDLPVEAVANQVGYNDMKHFHQLFREHIGMTPRAYRIMLRQ